jgi:hypothetical protein
MKKEIRKTSYIEPSEAPFFEEEEFLMEKNDTVLKDFEYARNNLLIMIEQQHISLEKLTDLASRSQNARTYEVLSGFIKTMTETNKDLLELQAKIQVLTNKMPVVTSPKTINQTIVFSGSTAELQKALKTLNIAKKEEASIC